MVEVDSSNLTQLEPPILNVLAATQLVNTAKTDRLKEGVMYSTMLLKSYHPL